MKLASLVVMMMLSVAGTAHADPGPRQPGAAKAQLRQLLLERFDRNGDGRLGPQERQRAARALHRLANRIMQGGERHPRADRQQRHRKLIRRFDRDRDGHVGPGELPPAIADELRPLDRDGDGWLEGNEVP
jgi:Ca2+-binding EF-hand superfamily protein